MTRKNNNNRTALIWVAAIVVIGAFFLCQNNKADNATAEDKQTSGHQQREQTATVANDTAHLELPAINDGETILRRTAYTVSYDAETRLPRWVAWHLTASHTDGEYDRNGLKFAEDYDVPEPRATNDDYRNSGYDRGHLCPSGDNKWSREAQVQSFLYTNCCPQVHSLNAGDWNELEQRCRKWAEDFGGVYIVSGPILDTGKKHKTIGPHKVVVPERFFKVILYMGKSPMAIGFVCDNEDGDRALNDYVATVDEVERLTGLDFFPSLPDDIEAEVESKASLNDWKSPIKVDKKRANDDAAMIRR